MTAVEIPTDTAVAQVLERTFEAELAAGDGRTIEARIAPYGVPATVSDPPTWTPYRELFAPGAFERQVTAPDRVKVWLNFEHEQGLRGIVGHGTELHDRADGLHGTFRVHENADGDKALQLVNDGILTGLSLEFVSRRSRVVDGVVHRLRVHIDKVSLCRTPAYTDSRVLAVRDDHARQMVDTSAGAGACANCGHAASSHDACSVAGCDCVGYEADEPNEPMDAAMPPAPRAAPIEAAPMDDDLADRLARLGVVPLRRMAMTSKSWDGSPARFTDEQYAASALFCRPGDASAKERCSLPVLEPDGTLNVNALGAAAGALAGARGGLASMTPALKATAARKLMRYYSAAGMMPPPSVTAAARS